MSHPLNVHDTSDCPFCKITRGEAPATVLRHWGDCMAIVPLDPVTLGHTLIIPTVHVPDALADPHIAGLVMVRAAEFARDQYVTGYVGAVGYNLITSIGAAATQTVWHYHLHVVPRRVGDALSLPWDRR